MHARLFFQEACALDFLRNQTMPKCIDYTLEDQSDVFLATGTKISSRSSSSYTILDRDNNREAGMPAAAICGMVAGYIK